MSVIYNVYNEIGQIKTIISYSINITRCSFENDKSDQEIPRNSQKPN